MSVRASAYLKMLEGFGRSGRRELLRLAKTPRIEVMEDDSDWFSRIVERHRKWMCPVPWKTRQILLEAFFTLPIWDRFNRKKGLLSSLSSLFSTTILPSVPVMRGVMADLADFHKAFLTKYSS